MISRKSGQGNSKILIFEQEATEKGYLSRRKYILDRGKASGKTGGVEPCVVCMKTVRRAM